MAKKLLLTDETVIDKIYLIRGQKVMLDKDLAELYNVMTGNLNKAVNRNLKRFPKDFMFQLNQREFKNLIFQNGISSWGGTRTTPYAFTEQGVAMLSSILSSDRAILVSIHIVRVFTKIRQILSTRKDVLLKLEKLEKKVSSHDGEIKIIFEYLKELLAPKAEPLRKIGFKQKHLSGENIKS